MKNSYITVTDQFCGAGGSSIGAIKAGAEIRLAMNHWKLACETYGTNHQINPICTDVSATDPRRYPSTDILITSPECTNHSLAKGRPRQYYTKDIFGNILIDPAEERSRATMWDVPRFAEYHDYRMIVVENVVDAGKWIMWESWLHAMHALGYEHQVVYFNSMFAWPTPQSRDRMYTIFWKKGNLAPNMNIEPLAFCLHCGKDVNSIQTWKKPLRWGRYKAQYFYRCPQCHQEIVPYYYAAFNAVDFSLPAQRIGDRQRPLKPKTMERIKYGFEKYGKHPMVITGRYTSGIECRVRDACNDVIPTQPGDSSHAWLFPWTVETGYTHSGNNRADASTDPLNTQTTRQTIGLVGFLSKMYGGNPGSMNIGLDGPTGTITTLDHHALIAPGFLVRQNDIGHGTPARRSFSPEDPLATITTQDTTAFVGTPFVAELHGTAKAGSLEEPLMCVTAGGNHHALLSSDAFVSYFYGTSQASGMVDPLNTMTGKDHAALIGSLETMQIEDLTFRMLQSQEIGKAMAFPSSYVVLGSNKDRVRQYGNAVTPPAMEMLLKRCIETLR